MQRQVSVFLVAVCLGLFCGCSKESPAAGASSGEVVFVRADGWDLTAANISNAVMVRARMAELAKRPIPQKHFVKWANRFAMGSAPGLLQSHLLEKEILRQGIARTAVSDATILARYNKMTRMTCADESELAKKFGPLEPAFREQFERDCLFESFFASNSSCVVSEMEIALRYQQLTNRFVRSQAIDRESHAKADAAMKRLRAGEAWEVVASNVTEDALIEESYHDNWQNWGSFKAGALEPEALLTAVLALKDGGFTEPIETDEGLVIVRLLERDGDLYTLARILFRMGAMVEFPEREEMVSRMVSEKRENLQRRLLPVLHDRAKVEYPMGTNFVYKIWKEAEQSEPPLKAKRPRKHAHKKSKK